MFITNLLVAGGVAYAGLKTAAGQAHHKADDAPATEVSRSAASETVVADIQSLSLPTLAQRRQRALAATSIWLTVGGVFIPSFTLVSIPLTIYSVVPIFEAGCRSLFAEGRFQPSVFNSILIGSALLTDNYFPAATLTWLHHTFQQLGQRMETASKRMGNEMNGEVGDLLRQVMGGAPRTVWVVQADVETKIPFEQLQVGDVIVVSKNEFVPVDGEITAGKATVNFVLLTRSTTPDTVNVGDKIYTNTFVTEGRIRVRVEEIRLRSTTST